MMISLEHILARYFNNGDVQSLYTSNGYYSEKWRKSYDTLISLLYDVRDLTYKDSIEDVIDELDEIYDE